MIAQHEEKAIEDAKEEIEKINLEYEAKSENVKQTFARKKKGHR
jgi:hypothetical protein